MRAEEIFHGEGIVGLRLPRHRISDARLLELFAAGRLGLNDELIDGYWLCASTPRLVYPSASGREVREVVHIACGCVSEDDDPHFATISSLQLPGSRHSGHQLQEFAIFELADAVERANALIEAVEGRRQASADPEAEAAEIDWRFDIETVRERLCERARGVSTANAAGA
jgi:hypothetical protein